VPRTRVVPPAELRIPEWVALADVIRANTPAAFAPIQEVDNEEENW